MSCLLSATTSLACAASGLCRTRFTWHRATCNGRCCTCRAIEQVYRQGFATSTIHDSDSTSIDTACCHEVVLCSISTSLCSTGRIRSTCIDNDRACRVRVTAQCDRKVIKSGFLVVKLDIAILVKLLAFGLGSSNYRERA